jgi:hypothetical protein
MTKDDFIEIALFSLPDYSNKEELDRVKLDLAWRYDNGVEHLQCGRIYHDAGRVWRIQHYAGRRMHGTYELFD